MANVAVRYTCHVAVHVSCAGYGYHSYGHQYCKEVSQETCYNVPVVTPLEVAVMLTFPQPMRECMDKPISLPR